MQTIGFIGIGMMGQGMIRNLRKAGYPVQMYNRSREKAVPLEATGAVWKGTISECVKGAQVIITIVGYPKDVDEVYFGRQGVLEHAAPGTILVDMTTTSPKLSQRIYEAAAIRGLAALDAPVSGGNSGAAQGTLAIMVGGDKTAFNAVRPVLDTMGSNVVYQGSAGAGQHAKIANQIAVAGALAGVCEALAYAERAGLSQETVFRTVRTGAARSGQMDTVAPKIIAGDFSATFYLKHYVKDLTIAAEEGRQHGLALDVLEQVLKAFRELEVCGYGNEGIQALIRHYLEYDKTLNQK